jgi:hypothetical protein
LLKQSPLLLLLLLPGAVAIEVGVAHAGVVTVVVAVSAMC